MKLYVETPAYRAEKAENVSKVDNIDDFFSITQDLTGMFTKWEWTTEGANRIPYELLEKQKNWLSLFGKGPKRRALLASRDKGKSEIVTILGSAWNIYQNPKIRIGIMSFSFANAYKLASKAKDILESHGLILKHTGAGNWYTSENKTHTPSIMAMGLSTAVRGMHFDFVILDDPLTVTQQFSKTFIDKTRHFLHECGSISDRTILIGQLLTRNDLYYDALTSDPDTYMVLQSWHGDIPELDKDLTLLERSISKKELARNYLGYIDDQEEAIFAPIQFDESLPSDPTYAFIDPSAKGRDFTAVAVAWHSEGRLIFYGKIFKKNWGDCLDQIVELVKNCKLVYFEDNLGTSIGRFLAERGVVCSGVTSTRTKIEKIYSLRALVLQDRIRLSNHMDSESVDQVKNWTETAEHDDLPDAISMLTQKLGWILHV